MRTITHTNRKIALIALALMAIFGIASSSNVAAQHICGPCSGTERYEIEIGNWPIQLGYANVTVDVVNYNTGTTSTQFHTGLLTGKYSYQFFPTNPSSQQTIGNITLATNLGTIYWITCVNGTSECFYLSNGTQFACVKITFTYVGTGNNPCMKIKIESVPCPC